MIGVLSRNRERASVEEFFEIFKTPWEFYEDGHSYDVVITTQEFPADLKAKVVFVLGSEKKPFDEAQGLESSTVPEGVMLEFGHRVFPVYDGVMKFGVQDGAIICLQGTHEAVGIQIRDSETTFFRIGIDLFGEVEHILSIGQPAEHARIPTIEIYRSMIRDLILEAGLPVLEIPPVPNGYGFTVCLSHDVDFVWMRRHVFDHTLFGFFYRALIVSLADFLRGKVRFRKVLRNWAAALKAPLVLLGISKDYWQQFDRYVQLEKPRGSTFFFIPLKNHAGKALRGDDRADPKRATRYDIDDVEPFVKYLVASGCEIGLHGIDSWHDSEQGRKELERIRRVTGDGDIGVRMHWLFHNAKSAQALDDAGFDYDSTSGYNEAVGYRSGTTQVYRPPGVRRLLELPMHVQDTALFYPRKMSLGEAEAREEVSRLLENAEHYGGVVTVNWHHRSIAPERLWDDFYVDFLEDIQKRKAWTGTARQVVEWFRKRRSVTFERVGRSSSQLAVRVCCSGSAEVPDLVLRIHEPELDGSSPTSEGQKTYRDLDFSEGLVEEIAL